MIVGFTGTQHGMTPAQRDTVLQLLLGMKPLAFHHGDCIGADEEAHRLAEQVGLVPVIHPPHNPVKRAFCKGLIQPSFPYLTRNRHIVDASDILIACPRETKYRRRSGTWSTMSYARKLKKPVHVVWPDGNHFVLST